MRLQRIPPRCGGRVPDWIPRFWISRFKGYELGNTKFSGTTLYNFAIGPLWLMLVKDNE